MNARTFLVLWGLAFAGPRLVHAQPGPEASCGLEDPAIAERAGKPPRKASPPGRALRGPAVATVRARAGGGGLGPTGHRATGALSGKTIYVSPGHGWAHYLSIDGWTTQRGNTNGIVEDFVSAEAIDEVLLGALRNMGAHVVPLREPDLNPTRVIVDEGDAVIEGATATPGPVGWGEVPLPITSDDVNPFRAGTSSVLATTTATASTARARFVAELPARGDHNVYVAYAQDPGRAPDAHYVIRHSGGEAHVRVDQRRHGSTWVLLGRWHFAATAEVVLENDSATAGATVSVDAVRLGGGMSMISRGGVLHPRPMFEIAARYYAQWNGAPRTVFDYTTLDNNNDVGTRARFAAWDHEDGEDAVYVAWHTNAPNPGRGTSSYTYGPDPPNGTLGAFSGVPGSRELQDAIHAELIGDLRAVFEPTWQDRGRHTAYFGEVNPDHNDEMPAVLIEVAYHDTPADAAALKEPRFRRIAARAFAQGIARYFAARDGAALTLAPEPPVALRVENVDGALRVAWRPPLPDAAGGDAPTGYRVYRSPDGRGFDEGTDVDGESVVLEGLRAGDVVFVRVAALNAGGESFPTEVVGARVAAGGAAPVLVVGGFDRLDAALAIREDVPGLGLVDRHVLARMNDGTYAARHGLAIAAAGHSFDGASDEAVSEGDVDIAAYAVVDWFLGEESSGDDPLDAGARAAIARLVAAGGALFVSGSELAWALGELGSPADQMFLSGTLHASFAGDDAMTSAIDPAPEGPYAGLPAFRFDDPTVYDPDYPDVLGAGVGASASVALVYGGAAGTAGIAWETGVFLGFPFETIVGDDVRGDVMRATLDHFGLPEEQLPDGGGPAGGDGGTDPAADGGGGCGCRVGRAGSSAGGGGLAALALLLLAGFVRSGSRGRRPI